LRYSRVDGEEVCIGIFYLDLEESVVKLGFEDKVIVEGEGLS
jgi:hypothetical protein